MNMETAVSKLQHSLLCWDFCPLIFVLFYKLTSSYPMTAPIPKLSRAHTTVLGPRRRPKSLQLTCQAQQWDSLYFCGCYPGNLCFYD